MDSVDTHVDIAVPLPLFQLFTYRPPPDADPLVPGSRVLVPFGSRRLTGIIVQSRRPSRADSVKTVQAVLDQSPVVAQPLLELALWVASYYFAPPGEVFRAMLPPGLLHKNATLKETNFWPVKKRLAIVAVSEESDGLTPRQREILGLLRNRKLPVFLRQFVRDAHCSTNLLQSLQQRDLLRIEASEVIRSPWRADRTPSVVRHRLTSEQRQIVDKLRLRLDRSGFQSVLIHGVTGSGKTEIYLNVIAAVLKRDKTALVLVPEIGLTPQVSKAFRGWFGTRVTVLHSGLSDGERFDQWRQIRDGQAQVVIGTRSAVFAPLRNLGVIIVDEEHDHSYKQEELPRYHARDTALKRGQLEQVLVVLGSATPQMETFYSARHSGRHQYEILSSRILDRPLPEVRAIDMRVEFERHGKAAVVSTALEEAIRNRLQLGEQTIILLNRRGYSSALLCRSCGYVEVCSHCSISLTYHQQGHRLICHYCGDRREVPARCAQCGKEYIFFLGVGTEKVHEMLQQMFPAARLDRLDRDAVQRKGSMHRILEDFARGATDILIGTQMIAKGHDFPNVTLVGVLAAEQGLRLADFRAAERTFQLLTQVAGRAGRGDRPGEVIIQTYYPDHYTLKYTRSQDYRKFFQAELRFRRRFRYPPFTALANLLVKGRPEHQIRSLAGRAAARLRDAAASHSAPSRMRILGPAPAALERLRGEYRFQILIKATDRKELHRVIDKSLQELDLEGVRRNKVSVDIDPVNLL